jgi:DNA-directed RNA polymerase specialized sigma24 family protein
MAFQPPMSADASLIQSCLAGNKSAWDSLVTQQLPAVMRMARKYGLTPQDAEDVTQRTFKQVFMKLSQKNQTDPLGAWIGRIAWHILSEYFKARKMVVPLTEDIPSQNGDMQHSVEIRIVFERIGRRLVGNEKKVWDAMTDLLTLNDNTIAAVTGLSVATCHTTRMRVEQKAREEMTRQGLNIHVPKTGS